MDELKMYVISRMLWNTSDDDVVAIFEFISHYYGAAAPFIRLYMDIFHGSVAETAFYMHESFGPEAPFLTPLALITAAQAFNNGLQVGEWERRCSRRWNRLSCAPPYIL